MPLAPAGGTHPACSGCDQLTAFRVEIAPQQLGSRGGEADELDPPSMTPLAECLCLLKQASCGPVTQAQPHDFRDTASGFEKNARNALFLQTPADARPPLRIRAGNSGSSMTCGIQDSPDKLEVAVREPTLAGRDNPADFRYSWKGVVAADLLLNFGKYRQTVHQPRGWRGRIDLAPCMTR